MSCLDFSSSRSAAAEPHVGKGGPCSWRWWGGRERIAAAQSLFKASPAPESVETGADIDKAERCTRSPHVRLAVGGTIEK